MKYRFSLEPLNTKGSLSDPGGRFNIGAIDTARFAVFAGLYLAFDKSTALAELFGRRHAERQALTPEELALTSPNSVTVVSASGELESALDVCKQNNLLSFRNLISPFSVSKNLIRKAKTLGISSPQLVRTVEEMAESLLSQHWRLWPMQLNIPAPSQIFGRIVMDAGIEGIAYTSVLTQKPCLVIYPQNFENSSSFIELDDPVPADTVQKRIDRSTFRNFV